MTTTVRLWCEIAVEDALHDGFEEGMGATECGEVVDRAQWGWCTEKERQWSSSWLLPSMGEA